MLGKLIGWDDTIVALATPPGVGAIAVLRVSGNKSLGIVNGLFPSKDLQAQDSHTMHVGFMHYNNKVLDEVVVSIFKAPKSYTGEDVIEVSCHGSPFVQGEVVRAILACGARLAKPGEFTQRAFLNGKLDLAQAEAVADLIASNTEASQKNALNNIRGGFSRVLQELREKMLRFSALIELELDFSQEDVEFADRHAFYKLVTEADKMTGELLDSFLLGNVIRNGVQVAIIGKPNAGKSTLLNTLLNENRAIVSEIAGTTRDTIEEIINIEGILFRLIDTAGIRHHAADIIENFGVERSLEKLDQADIVLYLFDALADREEVIAAKQMLEGKGKKFLLVANKIDLHDEKPIIQKLIGIDEMVFISAQQRIHTDRLKSMLVNKVMEGKSHSESAIITNARHYHALQEVSASLADIRKGLDEKLPGDLLSPDIRRCLHFLGEITGEVTTEDQLDYIFSKFCIGK